MFGDLVKGHGGWQVRGIGGGIAEGRRVKVVALRARGLPASQIASRLGLHISTVNRAIAAARATSPRVRAVLPVKRARVALTVAAYREQEEAALKGWREGQNAISEITTGSTSTPSPSDNARA